MIQMFEKGKRCLAKGEKLWRRTIADLNSPLGCREGGVCGVRIPLLSTSSATVRKILVGFSVVVPGVSVPHFRKLIKLCP